MGVLGAITAVSGLVSAGTSIAEGVAQKNAAEQNAQIFEAQAANIQTQKSILAGQYRTKTAQLKGTAVATAAHSGVKISGGVAQSISQSITQLQIEQSYEQYNLDVQKQKALDEAALQRYKGRQALMSGFLNAGTTALSAGSDYYKKYWGGSTNNVNSIGTTVKHIGSSISNGWYNVTHGISSKKSKYAMEGLTS